MPSYKNGQWRARVKRDGIEYSLGNHTTFNQAQEAERAWALSWPPRQSAEEHSLQRALEHLLNSFSLENGSDTPDFVLATFLLNCLRAFDQGVQERQKFYGKETTEG